MKDKYKSMLYARLLKVGTVQVNENDSKHLRDLEFEKMVSIRNNRATIEPYCDEEYHVQKMENERIFKTIVSLVRMDDEGNRKIVRRLYLPFHFPLNHARKIFLEANNDLKEDERNVIEVQHTDSRNRKVWTI